MAKQFDLSEQQLQNFNERAKRRVALRAEFLKKSTDPFRHGTGEGGYVFDAAVQRYTAMGVSTYEHFIPNARRVGLGIALIIPFFAYGYWIKSHRDQVESRYRSGEVAYKDRMFKLI